MRYIGIGQRYAYDPVDDAKRLGTVDNICGTLQFEGWWKDRINITEFSNKKSSSITIRGKEAIRRTIDVLAKCLEEAK